MNDKLTTLRWILAGVSCIGLLSSSAGVQGQTGKDWAGTVAALHKPAAAPAAEDGKLRIICFGRTRTTTNSAPAAWPRCGPPAAIT